MLTHHHGWRWWYRLRSRERSRGRSRERGRRLWVGRMGCRWCRFGRRVPICAVLSRIRRFGRACRRWTRRDRCLHARSSSEWRGQRPDPLGCRLGRVAHRARSPPAPRLNFKRGQNTNQTELWCAQTEAANQTEGRVGSGVGLQAAGQSLSADPECCAADSTSLTAIGTRAGAS